ncbi:LysR family transcriptional regulator [Mesorhizobium amorphae]|uniref:LysR family transcriptional regulator n=1 Tax=Mesorhizobium amorphae CCNWGS0123 TaxID=1082933 RepID=G6Y272_9HYPH|nr:LysR family transcriptional regulator [Mesorhizobium amorphae]ANT49773.1 LysR family transcriptional regulator [Mesorhizobium amorphae CCNWGS0123]EHH14157.1 LysR family transcriptional regulator [Mesorhizobium amorphae CCNWGS0123]GLR40099.1 LysR family transcriptional regulator [Mesorhizobium amorphae]
MNETDIDWSDLRIFLAVARDGSLSSAAKAVGQSAATLSRHIVDLERALGAELFSRLPSGYELTAAGRALTSQAETIEQRFLDIAREFSRRNVSAPIRVSAGTWMTWYLARNIEKLGLSDRNIVFSAIEEVQNIGRREALIGIRNRRPSEPGVAARRTKTVAFAPYAHPNAVRKTDWIAATVNTPSAIWVRANRRDQIRFEVTQPRSLLDLALAGAGHVVLPCFVGDAHNDLVRTDDVIEELSHEQWLVVHGDDRKLPEVRATIDKIARLIGSDRSFDGKS